MNYNVPEGSYSTDPEHGEVRIREMKEMIQALHSQGFRVIMDVVYNHTYSLDSWFQRTAPWYFYRVFDDGRISNGSACGNDVASEREMCAKYILESVLYWTEEYHIDGFRFDLMGLLDVNLMNRIRRELDARYGKGEKILFGEPWAAAETAMEGNAVPALKKNIMLLDENIGMFCDDTRDAVKGSALKIKRPGFINGASGKENDIVQSARAWCATSCGSTDEDSDSVTTVKAPSQVITYVSAHDNQTLWDKLAETLPEADEAERMRLNRMAAAIYMTCQGSLFFLSGEEFARTKNGLEDSFNAPITLNRLDWKQAWENQSLVEYYKGLIALRTRLPGLCDKSARASKRISNVETSEGLVSFEVDNRSETGCQKWNRLKIVYNGTREYRRVEVKENGWMILCDGEDSRLWASAKYAGKDLQAEPQSVLILGRLAEQSVGGTGSVAAEVAEVTEETAEKETWEKQAV